MHQIYMCKSISLSKEALGTFFIVKHILDLEVGKATKQSFPCPTCFPILKK